MFRKQRARREGSTRPIRKHASKFRALEQLEDRCLLSARPALTTWTITGDHDPQNPDDQIVIDRDPAHPSVIRAIVNGTVVNQGQGSSLTEGKILIQSEGAEIYFRRIELRPLSARD